jgi:hypothetical protein
MVPLGLDIKGCDFFIFVRAVDDDNSQTQGSCHMDNSHIFNKKILTIYWEIGATTPFSALKLEKDSCWTSARQ